MEYNHYNRRLKPFALNLRNNSTKAEIHLWVEILKNKQLLGYPFLRQRPIGRYIADFFCKELKLLIEVDGGSHVMKGEYDKYRDEYLAELGYATLRFSNENVLFNTEEVRVVLENWISVRRGR